MLDRFLSSEYALWLVAAALYALDVARLIGPDQFLSEERSGGRLRPVLSRVPFELRGQHLYWQGAFTPMWGVFLGVISQSGGSSVAEVAEVSRIDALRSELKPFRLIAVASFLLIFLVAPVLTYALGLVLAALIVLPLAYGLALGTAALLVARRAALRLTKSEVLAVSAECLLCAPYVANVVKKITSRKSIPLIGLEYSLRHAEESAREEVRRALDARSQSMVDVEGQRDKSDEGH